MSWWDQIGTGVGEALVNINQPFGMAPPAGYDRQAAMRSGALQLGTNMLANPYANPMEALGKGYQQAQSQGGDRALKALQVQQMMSEMDEQKRKKAQEEERSMLLQRSMQGLPPDKQALAQAFPEAFAEQQFTTAFPAPEKPTDDLREYAAARQQGYKGNFMDYQLELRKAQADKTTIDMKGESEFEKEFGKAQAQRFNTILEEGAKANDTIGNVQALRDIGANLQTGKEAEILASIGPWAEAFGVDIANLGEMQAYDAVVAKIAPSLRTPGVGAMSDYELKQFIKALPGLGKTPEGNAIIQNTLQAVAEHKKAAADIVGRMMDGEFNRTTADKMIRELGDPWSMWKEARKSLKSAPAGKADLKSKYGLE